MNITGVARVCHEVNRAYCEFLGDSSQVPWDEAPQWQKYSAIDGVFFHLGDDHLPGASHQRWMDHKAKEGWTYGPVKDADKKQHPCMVPFEELPPDQQLKDHLFCAVVHSMRRAAQNMKAKDDVLQRVGVLAGEAMSNGGHEVEALTEIFHIASQEIDE